MTYKLTLFPMTIPEVQNRLKDLGYGLQCQVKDGVRFKNRDTGEVLTIRRPSFVDDEGTPAYDETYILDVLNCLNGNYNGDIISILTAKRDKPH
ncbi:MAG: hypothetical protein L3J37_00295 [Rhodobacteraceae bacterium]|nr:hypothetical protein [Paracoccaceae bacterium]